MTTDEKITLADVDVMAAGAVRQWVEAGHSLDDLRVAVDKRMAAGDKSAERLAVAIAYAEQAKT